MTCAYVSLPACLAAHALSAGERIALRDDCGTATYAELVDVAGKLARGLVDRGVQPGDRIGLAMEPSAGYVTAVLGVLRAGAVAVPLNSRLTLPETVSYLGPLEPRLLIVDPAHERWTQGLEATSLVAQDIDDRGSLQDRLGDLIGDEILQVDLAADAPAIVFPTGGTTGLPKGAWYSHRGLSAFCAAAAAGQDRSPRDVEIYCSPFFHVSLLTGLLTGLSAGGSADVLRTFDAAAALDAIARGGTRLMGSPTMFVALRQSASFATTDRSGVTHVGFGATDATKPFVDGLLRDFPSARLFYSYGATEYGPVTAMPHETMVEGTRTGVGRAVAGVELRIVGTDGEPVPTGETGELVVSCPWQAEGYWGRTEETAETFTPHGVRLGDMGRVDEDGWVVLSGRSKELIITGGENVFPIEVENVLALHPAVSEVCVYGVADEYWGERVEAAVVAHAGASFETADLVAFARTRLAGYKVPKVVREVAALPLTPNNKPDRRALRATALP